MDTKCLLTFVTFAEQKSYLKTSFKLNYAPSTLAEHIRALEEELGIKLVESRGKRSFLTKGGREFLPYARQFLSIYKASLHMAENYHRIQGTLRIMTVESLGLYSIASVFTKYMTQYPDVTLSIRIGNCESIPDKLKNDEIDVAYTYDMKPISVSGLHTEVLFKEDLCFVVSPKHPLAKKTAIIAADFNRQTFILAQRDCYYAAYFTKILAENNVHLSKRLEFDSGNLIKQSVKSNHGIALLPYSVVEAELLCGELKRLNWQGDKLEAYAQLLTTKDNIQLPSITELAKISVAPYSGIFE